jgi:hypothetical protein
LALRGGAKSEIDEARFLLHGLAISPPGFLRFFKVAFPPDFLKKKLAGTLVGHPLLTGLEAGDGGLMGLWAICRRCDVGR